MNINLYHFRYFILDVGTVLVQLMRGPAVGSGQAANYVEITIVQKTFQLFLILCHFIHSYSSILTIILLI